jgi:hypothetical protein
MTDQEKSDALTDEERVELYELRKKRVEQLEKDIKSLKNYIGICSDGVLTNKKRIEALNDKLDKKEKPKDEINYVH